MKWNLILHELRQIQKSVLWAIFVSSLLIALLLMKADSYIGNPEMIKLIGSMPKPLLAAFNIVPDSFKSFEGYFASQAYTILVLLLGCFAAIWAASSIAKELDRGTGEFLFALPYTRGQVFISKVVAHFFSLTLLFIVAASLTLLIAALTIGVNDPGNIILLTTGGYLICLLLSGIGYMLTPLFTSERTSMAVGFGILLGSFIPTILGGGGRFLQKLSKLSPMHLFDAAAVVKGSGLTVSGLLVTLGIYIGGIWIGSYILQRRDLS
ncbi:ABC-type transport system involved in multi-copper enzyme maturation, permease component [Paenibacillus sp. yr247]|uniref:ABC transporter permease subunit n=1 Tax=Paenibacillus sp. yr247 TaxID=1761880 RepID=UPI00088AF5EF|nr:ABC transporter permease subunit [Paenibacillus sp. yr247]SDN53418.1 ABC-type transport system involved in multi-copper enzyme maturation, permease component [Paenibacillus sp. yr247]